MPSITKKPRRSIALAQNFLNNTDIITAIIRSVDFSMADLIIEIGPGKGIITDALIKKHNRVIGVEIDRVLFLNLEKKYKGVENVSIVHSDFLKYHLPNEKFSIVANIPFNITAEIIRKITDRNSLLQAAYIITEERAAYKFVGAPYAESPLLAHFLHIHYEVKYLMQINGKNFTPVPNVAVGLISIIKRKVPIFNNTDEQQFNDLLTYIFVRKGATLKEGLKRVFSNLQTKIIIEQLNLSESILKKKVTFNDWVNIYSSFVKHGSPKSKMIIRGAFEKLGHDKAKLKSQLVHRNNAQNFRYKK